MIDRPLLPTEGLATPLRELMTPGVVAVPASASLKRVFEAMQAHRVHAVLVVDDGSAAPLGWVTSRALLRYATADLSLHTARDAVDEPAISLSPSATAAEAIEQLLAGEANRIAVCRDAAALPEGIVSDLDLVALLVRRHV